MIGVSWKAAICTVLVLLTAWPELGNADQQGSDSEALTQLRQQLEDLRRQNEAQAQLIRRLDARIQELEVAQRGRGGPQEGTSDAQPPVARAEAAGQAAAPAAPAETEAQRSLVLEQVAQQEHAPLFQRQLTLEPGLSYARFDRRFLTLSGFLALDAVFLGEIDLQQTRSDAFTFDLTARYGLSDRMSVDLNLPWITRRNAFIEGGTGGAAATPSEATVSAGDLGDVNAGLYYQILRETPRRPDVVGSLRLRAPTGREPYGIKFVTPDPANNNFAVPETLPTGLGVWTAQLGVSLLKTSDPLVFFGNLAYHHNFERHFDDISPTANLRQPGAVSLGDAWQWGAGLAVAFNERASVSMALSHQIGRATRLRPDGQDWQSVVGSDYSAATLQTGVTYQLSDTLFAAGSLGIGLTPDAPDFTVGIKFPYSF